jgi:hypothetical protein
MSAGSSSNDVRGSPFADVYVYTLWRPDKRYPELSKTGEDHEALLSRLQKRGQRLCWQVELYLGHAFLWQIMADFRGRRSSEFRFIFQCLYPYCGIPYYGGVFYSNADSATYGGEGDRHNNLQANVLFLACIFPSHQPPRLR